MAVSEARYLPFGRKLKWLGALLLCFTIAACDSVEDRIANHFERGQELLETEELDKALLEFRNVLQLDDRHAPSYFAMAKIFEAKGELQAAFGHYQKSAELDPENGEARLKLARFYVLGNAYDEAERELAAVLELLPNNAEAHVLEASLALRQNDPAAAKPWIEKAAALAPGNPDLVLAEVSYIMQTAGDAAAVARVDQGLTEHPENLALYLIKLQLLERMDNQPGIGAHLGDMIDQFPEEPRFRQARAEWALRNEDMETAEAELRAIVSSLPENREAIVTLIRFLGQQHGTAVARAELAELIKDAAEPFPLELMLAQLDIQSGQTEAAVEYLRDLIGRAGENANQARIALAQLLVQRGDQEETYALVDEILADEPGNVEALVIRIARLIDEDQLEEAIQNVRLGLSEAPEDVRLLMLAARAQEFTGNIDLANDRLAKAVRTSEYDARVTERYVRFLMRINRATAADTVLTEAIERRQGSARLLDLLASIRLQLQNWSGAEQAIRGLESLDADRARQLRAALLIGQEQFDEGAGLLRAELPTDDARRSASVTALVQTYVRDGKTEEAVAFLEELLAENPENFQALGLRGNLHLAAGDFEAAEASYKAILAIDPTNGGAHSALSRLYAVQGDPAASEQALLTGLEASPDDTLLLVRLAQLREVQGDVDAAIELYGRLYDRTPDSILVANNLSALLADFRGDDPAAIDRAYTIAGRLRDLELPQYQDTYGWTRYLKGEYEEALDALMPAVEGLPNNPWVQYHVGMTYAALKQNAKARTHLETALEQGAQLPDFPPAEQIRETLGGLTDP